MSDNLEAVGFQVVEVNIECRSAATIFDGNEKLNARVRRSGFLRRNYSHFARQVPAGDHTGFADGFRLTAGNRRTPDNQQDQRGNRQNKPARGTIPRLETTGEICKGKPLG